MQDPQLLLNQGMQFMQANKPHLALPLFDQLEKQGVKDHRLYRVMGVAHERLQRFGDAIKYFEHSLALTQHQPDLLESIARLSGKLQQYERSVAAYRAALKQNNNAKIKLYLAFALLKIRPANIAEAASLFDAFIAAGQHLAKSFVGKARIAGMQNNSVAQKQYLEKAMTTDPSLDMALNDLAWWYKEQGDYKQALELFNKLNAIKPGNPDTLESLAITWLDAGNTENALTTIQSGLTQFPGDARLADLYASINYELNNKDYLKPYKELPVAQMPKAMLKDYFNKLLLDKQFDAAERVLNEAKVANKNQLDIAFMQANLCYQQDKFEQCITLLGNQFSSFERAPEDWLNKMALYYLALGDAPKALEPLEQLLLRFPDEQYYWGLKGIALRLMDAPEYNWLCRYDDFVFTAPIELPEGAENMAQFNDALLVELQTLHTMKHNPLAQSLLKGTQTTGNLFQRNNPKIKALQNSLQATIERQLKQLPEDELHPLLRRKTKDIEIVASWSVQLGAQGFHTPHVHPKGWYSSVYYVDVPESVASADDKQGWLNIGKPGIKLPVQLDAEKWVRPVPGELTIFPSYMWHGTEPFTDSKPRTTVAFDFVPR